MMIVELTTTVVGADIRGTALVGTSIGILAVIYRFSLQEPPKSLPGGQFDRIDPTQG